MKKQIVVASHNPVKIEAALGGFARMFPEETFELLPVNVPSNVSAQPMSSAETLQGAINRAEAAARLHPQAEYCVGIEGGIEPDGDALAAFAWIVVRSAGQMGKGRTGTFYLPPAVAALIHQGKELGEADDIVFQRSNSKQENGAIGLLTNNVIDRKRLYEEAVVMALIPFRNPAHYAAMHTKGQPPAAHIAPQAASPLVEAALEWNQLKQLYRQGWLRGGVPPVRCESVAEHTAGILWLALLLQAQHPELQSEKVLQMALLHDLGEVYAGDLTPAHAVSKTEKHHLEQQAVQQVLGKLPNTAPLLALWQEYETGESPEAVWVRQLDRLEMAVQACSYALQNLVNPAEYLQSAARVIHHPALRPILEELSALAGGQSGTHSASTPQWMDV